VCDSGRGCETGDRWSCCTAGRPQVDADARRKGGNGGACAGNPNQRRSRGRAAMQKLIHSTSRLAPLRDPALSAPAGALGVRRGAERTFPQRFQKRTSKTDAIVVSILAPLLGTAPLGWVCAEKGSKRMAADPCPLFRTAALGRACAKINVRDRTLECCGSPNASSISLRLLSYTGERAECLIALVREAIDLFPHPISARDGFWKRKSTCGAAILICPNSFKKLAERREIDRPTRSGIDEMPSGIDEVTMACFKEPSGIDEEPSRTDFQSTATTSTPIVTPPHPLL
jgi:hypothetical protein